MQACRRRAMRVEGQTNFRYLNDDYPAPASRETKELIRAEKGVEIY